MDIYGIEKFSLVDYDDNITCVLFTATCNFRCPFCHNSSLVNFNPNLKIIPEEEIFDYLHTRVGLVDAICITGGEPTLQPDLKEYLTKIKDLGYKIKLDSNGTRPEIIKELIDLKLIDYVAMDIKNTFDKYDLTSGVKVNKQKIQESIDLLKNSGIDYEFRTTIVNEFHTLDDMKEIAKMLKGCKRYFLQHFVASENCIQSNLHDIDYKTALSFKEALEQELDNVYLRGY